MENLEYSAKIAIVKVLMDILNADDIVRDSELEYINEVVKSFNLAETYNQDLTRMSTLQALSIIRELSDSLKSNIAQMMGKMIIIDKDINYNEVKLYNAFCESCKIASDFDMKDYSGYTLSGPFMNPEDL